MPEAPGPSAARQLVDRFVANANARQFDAVFILLSRPLRERYVNAERLQRDFEADPSARDRLEGIARAQGTPVEQGDTATLPWAPGRSLRLVRESDGWHVDALE